MERLHRLPLSQRLVVYAKKIYDKPEHLVRYIARYINRIAISNHRILSIDNGRVTFRYHDNRNDRDKTMTLSAEEFICRFLTHILPKGFRRIRYYGFLVNSQRKNKLTRCRELLNLTDPDKPYIASRGSRVEGVWSCNHANSDA